MAQIAREVERDAPRDTSLPANAHVESSYAEALDSVCSSFITRRTKYSMAHFLDRSDWRRLSSELQTPSRRHGVHSWPECSFLLLRFQDHEYAILFASMCIFCASFVCDAICPSNVLPSSTLCDAALISSVHIFSDLLWLSIADQR